MNQRYSKEAFPFPTTRPGATRNSPFKESALYVRTEGGLHPMLLVLAPGAALGTDRLSEGLLALGKDRTTLHQERPPPCVILRLGRRFLVC